MQKEYISYIQKLSFQFAKYHYDQYLKKTKSKFISKENVRNVVEMIYTNERKKELFSFIRQTLKTQLSDNYNPLLVEPLLQEISQDDSLSKERIILEIHEFQSEFYE